MRPRRAALAALLALGSALLAGCGWHAGLAAPAGARTIAVTFADNDTNVPGLEVAFTDALHRALLDRVDLDLTQGASADLRLESQLVDLRRRGGVRDDEARLLESGVTLVVESRLVDQRTGTALASSTRAISSGFVVGPGASPATAVGESAARERVIDNLADGVVLDLFAPLSYESAPATRSLPPGSTPTGPSEIDGPTPVE